MDAFLRWFEETSPKGQKPLGALARAGIAHLYFETIHPFEDGNGRIGRAISEKSLAQGLGRPSLTALSVTVEKRRKAYYAALERASRSNEVTDWLLWFADAVLDAQTRSSRWIDFLIEKAKLFDKLRSRLNPRQEKALVRMTREGPDGFTGGLSAGNYVTITGTSAATARRDLAELVDMGGLVRTGERKGTRYWLPFETAVRQREPRRWI
jgi:Fic family protein